MSYTQIFIQKKNKYISLGNDYLIKMVLKYFNKKEESFPLDWVKTSSFDTILNLFNNRFEDFICNPELLITEKKINRTQGKTKIIETYVYNNTKYNLQFFHDFPKDEEFIRIYPDVKKKYLRRINRLFDYLDSNSFNFKFIFYHSDLTNKHLLKFKHILSKINPELSYQLYIITHNTNIKNTDNKTCHYINSPYKYLFNSGLNSCDKFNSFIQNL